MVDAPEEGSGAAHHRLGVHLSGSGVTAALWAPAATAVDLCLLADDGDEVRHRLTERTDGVWHGHLPGVSAGQRYGWRLQGPRQFPDLLLLDPYARAVTGGYDPAAAAAGGDTAPHVPHAVVVDEAFDWGEDRRPQVSTAATVVYEAHLAQLTALHPAVPPELRGTYAGLAHPALTSYLVDLGVTSVELLPVQQFVSEPALTRRGMRNVWGYNTLGFFAPHADYATGSRGEQVTEFKAMVRALHTAGLEVLLDVVYNHTAEGEGHQPTLCFRGIDDLAYYRHDPHHPGRYADVTGCGNTFQAARGPGLRLVMDSLRYWVEQMHVDGFRFDLATALSRPYDGFDPHGALLGAIGQDPVLQRVKLIAEPWDVGPGGYQVGGFPVGWAEWNDRFRNGVRDFWRGHGGGVRELGWRLSGSSDLFRAGGRGPTASVNYMTAHDGFTLRDVVSYERKHNAANGESDADGTDDNRSSNAGTEGPADAATEALRRRQARNLLCTLLLAPGIPMLLAGDERWRTQDGNNNAYCARLTDPPAYTVGMSWADEPQVSDLHAWVRALLALRAEHPVLHAGRYLDGEQLPDADGALDLAWFAPDATPMTETRWHETDRVTLGRYLDGRAAAHRRPHTPATSFLFWVHAGTADTTVTLPGAAWGHGYDVLLDTRSERPDPGPAGLRPGAELTLGARSALLVQCHHHYSAQGVAAPAGPGR